MELVDIQSQGMEQYIDQVFDTLDVLPQTKKEYKKRVHVFLDYIHEHGWNKYTFRTFKEYIWMRNDWSTSTKNVYLTAARVFCNALHVEWVLPVDITKNVKSFSQSKKHKQFGINNEEVAELQSFLSSLPAGTKSQQIKNTRTKALFGLLLFQWLRQIEIARIDHDDVDMRNNVIQIQWKGKSDTEKIYLHPMNASLIQEYIDAYHIMSGPLFFSLSNNSKGSRITTRSIRRIVKDILNVLDIDKTTHWFRHYFTTTLLKEFWWDILKTKAFTRHASTEMLVVYNDEINHEKNLEDYYDSFSHITL